MLQFDDMGFLTPTKPIESNIDECRATFVFNDHRERLFTTYLNFLDALEKLEIGNYFQWIDSSFTTKKIAPNDIDLVSFVDFKAYKIKKTRLEDLKKQYKKQGIDAYFVEYYPENHPLSPINRYQLNDWLGIYGSTKPVGEQQSVFKKGFILINL